MRDTCRITGTPVDEDKLEGLAPVMPFFGIELDTLQVEIRLPADRGMERQERGSQTRPITYRYFLTPVKQFARDDPST